MKRFTIDIPNELHTRIKIGCTKRGLKMADWLREILEREFPPAVCAICGDEYDGWGNNPSPIAVKGRVCDACNEDSVIPARISLVKLVKKEVAT